MPEYIDTHSHIYLPEFDDDRALAIERAVKCGVSKIVLPNIDSTTMNRMHSAVTDYPGICFAMMGLHPTSVKENYREELDIAERCLQEGIYAGIGEIGIDLFWDKTHIEQQRKVFITQLEWSMAINLPVVIHARESFGEILEAMEPFRGKVRGIFHAYSGTIEIARTVIQMGFKLGIGGMITYKNSTLPGIIREIALDHLVLETDSPFLTPIPHRGKRNESSYIPYIAEAIHRIKNVPLDEVAKITTRNAMEVFHIFSV